MKTTVMMTAHYSVDGDSEDSQDDGESAEHSREEVTMSPEVVTTLDRPPQ